MKFQVIEDNGGGLHLFVLSGRRVIFAGTEYQHRPGNLTANIKALVEGDDAATWESSIDDPQAAYDYLNNSQYGSEIVAEGGKGRIRLHKARMGRAAQIEFDVSDEDVDAAKAAASLGRKGGASTSKVKSAASRENGKKGGRPRATPQPAG